MADDNSSILAALQGIDPAEAMPFGAGTTPQGSPTMLSGMLSGVMDIPKRLIDSAKNFNPNDVHQGVEGMVAPAADTAMALAGAGAPAAEAGAAGIFGGKLAQTADLRMLREAEQAAANGHLPDEIRNGTGWARSPADHQWRFEIPDNKMGLKYMPKSEGDMLLGLSGDMVSHQPLFSAYPQLRDMPLELTKNSNLFDAGTNVPRSIGSFYPEHEGVPPHITAEGPNPAKLTSTLAHEFQHAIQGIEGFAGGADPSNYSKLIMQGWRKNPAVLEGNPLANVLDRAYPLYRKTAGEVEARNVQDRLLWTPEQREVVHPWYSQDTPYRDQVVYDHNAGTIRALRQK